MAEVVNKRWPKTARFYECSCGGYHAVEDPHLDDCRDPSLCFEIKDLDARYGDEWRDVTDDTSETCKSA